METTHKKSIILVLSDVFLLPFLLYFCDIFVTFWWTLPKSSENNIEKMPQGPSGGTGDNSMTFLVTFWSPKGDILVPQRCINCLKCKKVNRKTRSTIAAVISRRIVRSAASNATNAAQQQHQAAEHNTQHQNGIRATEEESIDI